MNAVWHIGCNTFKETIRNKILYNILIVAGIVLLLSISFGDLSVFSRVQVMTDFGLATLSLTGLLLAVFIGVGMLGAEISNKTIYGVLTRPVGRTEFILGKFFGLLVTLLLNFLLITAVFFTAIALIGGALSPKLLWAVALIVAEIGVVIAAAMLFSIFTTPMLAAIFTLGFYIVGHLNDLITSGLIKSHATIWGMVLTALSYILPNLEHFNIRARIIFDLPVPQGYVAWACAYGVLYASLLLVLATLLFEKKDL